MHSPSAARQHAASTTPGQGRTPANLPTRPDAGGMHAEHQSQIREPAQASRALWSATLALMTAFMQTPAPAHRLMLARRIARNFATLADQPCFDDASRASFTRLHAHWTVKVERLTPGHKEPGALGWLRKLLPH